MAWSMSQADLSSCHQGTAAQGGPSVGMSLLLHQVLNDTPSEDTTLISRLEQTIESHVGTPACWQSPRGGAAQLLKLLCHHSTPACWALNHMV